MSGSETVNTQALPPQQQQPQQPMIQTMHLSYDGGGGHVYQPAASNGNGNGNVTAMGMGMGQKKKRGRPRKYGPIPDGGPPPPQPQLQNPPPQSVVGHAHPLHAAVHVAPPPAPAQPQQQSHTPNTTTVHNHQQIQVVSQQEGPTGSGSDQQVIKRRGRPPGSSNRPRVEPLGAPGIGFTPHVITVNAGEDVGSKIMSFSHNGPRAICILSANGAISTVTLRQAATSGGSVTYEGRFEILSLSGSFMLTDYGSQRSRTGGLSVSLAGPDGRILGGGVAGLLTAATPVQVVVGSFFPDGRRELSFANETEPLSAPSKLHSGIGATCVSSPPSRGTVSESSGAPASPLNQNTAVHTTPAGMSGLPWK